MDHRATQGTYEPPTIVVLGQVHVLTQASPKLHGQADGFAFGGRPITISSP
jgi:hypothetical protein